MTGEMKFWSFPPMTDADRLLMEFHAILKNPSVITDAYREHLIRRIEQRLAAPTEEGLIPIPLELARALANGGDSLAVWELRGLLERKSPQPDQDTK